MNGDESRQMACNNEKRVSHHTCVSGGDVSGMSRKKEHAFLSGVSDIKRQHMYEWARYPSMHAKWL
jgi:hypothetical protein